MDTSTHTLVALFEQLGLPSDAGSIRNFLARHGPLNAMQKLPEAPCWTPTQAEFLREAIADDAEWAVVVDELDALLRHRESAQLIGI